MVEEIDRLYSLFDKGWTGLVTAMEFGVEKTGETPYVTWHSYKSNKRFLAVVDLIGDEDHVPVDSFAVLVLQKQKEEGVVIVCEVSYVLDGDETPSQNDKLNIVFNLQNGVGWKGLSAILLRVLDSLGDVKYADFNYSMS